MLSAGTFGTSGVFASVLISAGWSLAAYFLLAAAVGETVLPPLVMAWGGLSISAVLLAVTSATGVVHVTANAGDVELLHRGVSWIVPVLELSLVAAVIA